MKRRDKGGEGKDQTPSHSEPYSNALQAGFDILGASAFVMLKKPFIKLPIWF
jgi:hypothetical protein